jgi:hypothetical protein
VSIGQFLNLQGQITTAFYPAVGDCGIEGRVVSVLIPKGESRAWGGIVIADAVQGKPNSSWALAPASGPQDCSPVPYGNPLDLQFNSAGLNFVPCVGQRVQFDVIAAPYGAVATNLRAI